MKSNDRFFPKSRKRHYLFLHTGDLGHHLVLRQNFEFSVFGFTKYTPFKNSVLNSEKVLGQQVLQRQCKFLHLVRRKSPVTLDIDRNLNYHLFKIKFISGFVLKDSSGEQKQFPTGEEKSLGFKYGD